MEAEEPASASSQSKEDGRGVAVLPAVTVSAQRPGSDTEGTGSYTTGTTRAATGLSLSPRETPQSVTVVTRQRMDDQQLNSIKDVLENTTGISSTALDTERVSYYSRGFSIDSFQYDGVPTTYIPGSFLPGEGVLDTAFYDRVEVVRGATGLQGVGDPSASVNLVRKRPLREFSDWFAGGWFSGTTIVECWTYPRRSPPPAMFARGWWVPIRIEIPSSTITSSVGRPSTVW
ncbi:TonB-dependent receptor plug domain-containing protein [Pseudomonas aeruginosa]